MSDDKPTAEEAEMHRAANSRPLPKGQFIHPTQHDAKERTTAFDEHLHAIKQAIAELLNCASPDSGLFLHGDWGKEQHAKAWAAKAMRAIAELEKMTNVKL